MRISRHGPLGDKWKQQLESVAQKENIPLDVVQEMAPGIATRLRISSRRAHVVALLVNMMKGKEPRGEQGKLLPFIFQVDQNVHRSLRLSARCGGDLNLMLSVEARIHAFRRTYKAIGTGVCKPCTCLTSRVTPATPSHKAGVQNLYCFECRFGCGLGH